MSKLKVAILGASGIGKNHARWFHGHGCEVAAFLGSSPASIEKTGDTLRAGFPFDGRGYTELDELLKTEKPDIVCVSNPPHLHYNQVMQCIDNGVHVLCEKPLVGYDEKPAQDIIDEANTLVERARQKGVLLGAQTQYATATDTILEMAKVQPKTEAVTQWSMEM
ncbi:MAG TPA: Gfo/Idh/MocA family oxidoreductase, partial [Abditibacteriaceae bacterium]